MFIFVFTLTLITHYRLSTECLNLTCPFLVEWVKAAKLKKTGHPVAGIALCAETDLINVTVLY